MEKIPACSVWHDWAPLSNLQKLVGSFCAMICHNTTTKVTATKVANFLEFNKSSTMFNQSSRFRATFWLSVSERRAQIRIKIFEEDNKIVSLSSRAQFTNYMEHIFGSILICLIMPIKGKKITLQSYLIALMGVSCLLSIYKTAFPVFVDLKDKDLLDLQKCPSCYGVNMCPAIITGEIRLVDWSQYTIGRFMNARNVYFW